LVGGSRLPVFVNLQKRGEKEALNKYKTNRLEKYKHQTRRISHLPTIDEKGSKNTERAAQLDAQNALAKVGRWPPKPHR
jgi:hypothetical protein